jgi:hypothetical protein
VFGCPIKENLRANSELIRVGPSQKTEGLRQSVLAWKLYNNSALVTNIFLQAGNSCFEGIFGRFGRLFGSMPLKLTRARPVSNMA